MASIYEMYKKAGVFNRDLTRHEREKRAARVRARLGLGTTREKLWGGIASKHKAVTGKDLTSLTPAYAYRGRSRKALARNGRSGNGLLASRV